MDKLVKLMRDDGLTTGRSLETIVNWLRANSALVLKEVGVQAGWSQPGKHLGEYLYSLNNEGYPEDIPNECVPLYAAKE